MMKSNKKVTFLGYVCVIRGLFKGLEWGTIVLSNHVVTRPSRPMMHPYPRVFVL